MILGLCNSKGGVGKSTLGRNILVYLNDQGMKSALIDAEEHAPTATLLRKFDSNLVCRSATTLDAIDDAVSELSSDGYHVILDAPGKKGTKFQLFVSCPTSLSFRFAYLNKTFYRRYRSSTW